MGEQMSIYNERGYSGRKDYLNSLAIEYGVHHDTVFLLASLLGRNEDFDGLISELETIEDMG